MVNDQINEVPDVENDSASKTQRKKQMHALQALGEQLTELTRDELAQIDLPDELREAIAFAQRVTAHEARRRHLQYVGKLMRRVDADSVRAQVGRATGNSQAAVALMHKAEQWRERLLADDEALTDLLTRYPSPESQWLRSTIRAARREHAAGKPPKHARELYRWLHRHFDDKPSTGSAAGTAS